MKKTLFLLFTLIIMVLLAVGVYAQGNVSDQWSVVSDQEVEQSITSYPLHSTSFKTYIEEKILPIIVGVVTSIIALLSTLRGIFSSLKSLKASKENFEREQEKIKESSRAELEKITEKYNEIKSEIKSVVQIKEGLCELKEKTEILSKEIENLSQIAALGFCKDKDLVLEGASREIVILAKENKELNNREEI
jgi:hypothetical protein